MAIAAKFPWQKHTTFVDVGVAEGCLAVQVALAPPHLVGESFDLPAVRPFFEGYVASFGLREPAAFSRRRFLQRPYADDGRSRDGHDPAGIALLTKSLSAE